MTTAYRIRRAVPADADALVDFTMQQALEAEATTLDRAAVARGVGAAFETPPLATYWVAEGAGGAVVAGTSIVTEWSDFHGGFYWWIQSIFILPGHRGTGLLDQLIEHLAAEAEAGGAVDLRLHAHASNERALRAYRRCGFREAPYVVMSRRKGSRGGARPVE